MHDLGLRNEAGGAVRPPFQCAHAAFAVAAGAQPGAPRGTQPLATPCHRLLTPAKIKAASGHSVLLSQRLGEVWSAVAMVVKRVSTTLLLAALAVVLCYPAEAFFSKKKKREYVAPKVGELYENADSWNVRIFDEESFEDSIKNEKLTVVEFHNPEYAVPGPFSPRFHLTPRQGARSAPVRRR